MQSTFEVTYPDLAAVKVGNLVCSNNQLHALTALVLKAYSKCMGFETLHEIEKGLFLHFFFFLICVFATPYKYANNV